jgi:hypothetical protein
MKNPYYMKMGTSEFKAARKRQYGMVDMSGLVPVLMMVSIPDEIICNACNAQILTDWIHVTRYGRWAVCDDCLPRWMEGI